MLSLEKMFNQEKKIVVLNGTVSLPLEIGKIATIFHNQGITRTSTVADIKQITQKYIIFETKNTNYCVITKLTPASAVVNNRMAFCA